VLNNRDVLVLVLSPAALNSRWVPAEMNAAIVRATQGFMRAPLVVSVRPVALQDIPGLWTTYHRIDATDDYTAALPRIVQALQFTLPAEPTSVPTSPSPVVGGRTQVDVSERP
jgi:hypothetical protein